jgi:hypothetical protein
LRNGHHGIAGARKDPVRSQRIPIDNDKQHARTATRPALGQWKFSFRVRSGDRRA